MLLYILLPPQLFLPGVFHWRITWLNFRVCEPPDAWKIGSIQLGETWILQVPKKVEYKNEYLDRRVQGLAELVDKNYIVERFAVDGHIKLAKNRQKKLDSELD